MTTNPFSTKPRPRKLVELDGVPTDSWRIEPDAVYLWKGRLWRKEPVGCVLCVELDDNDHLTFANTEGLGPSEFVCMRHGELREVPYELKKHYEITIGSVYREGEECVSDTMLFPNEMTYAAQAELIERLLDEAQREEVDAGPSPAE